MTYSFCQKNSDDFLLFLCFRTNRMACTLDISVEFPCEIISTYCFSEMWRVGSNSLVTLSIPSTKIGLFSLLESGWAKYVFPENYPLLPYLNLICFNGYFPLSFFILGICEFFLLSPSINNVIFFLN